MAVREIIRMGHPLLRKKSQAVDLDELDSAWLKSLVVDLEDTLADSKGIGLAAPQIGESHRVAIIKILGGASRYGELEPLPLTVYINPVIEVSDRAPQGFFEGCLSIPNLRGYVERPSQINLSFYDLLGNQHSANYKGFLATVFQHEFDHLDGLLFVDRMTDTTTLSFEDEFNRFQANF